MESPALARPVLLHRLMQFCEQCSGLLYSLMVSGKGISSVPSLGEVIEKTLANKTRLNRRGVYVDSLRQYLGQFAKGREAMPIDEVTLLMLEEWFASRCEQPSTMRSNVGRLSTVFDNAVRHSWIRENPAEKLELPFVERHAPKILTVEQCKSALEFTLNKKPDFLAWLVLALLCGLRPESEADNLERGRIDFENHRLIVAISKVRSHRMVDLRQIPPAEPWLAKAFEVGARFQIPYPTRRNYLRALREHLEFERWPQDVLRHSAASYLLAHHQSAERVAMLLGNSAGILHRHYKSLVTPEDAAKFMSLRP